MPRSPTGEPPASSSTTTDAVRPQPKGHQPGADGPSSCPDYTRSVMREIHARVALRFAEYVAEIPPDAWHRPTPCAEWDVRALVDHVVRWNTFIPELMAGQSLADLDRPFERD